MPRLVVVAVLGVSGRPTTYVPDSRRQHATPASVALTRLRLDVERVVALCTPDAEAGTLPVLRRGLPDREVVLNRLGDSTGSGRATRLRCPVRGRGSAPVARG